jgi:hypothetical protein
MRFFILVYNPKYILVQHIENIVRNLKNQTGYIIEPISHLDDRDMPLYLINSEENRIKEIEHGEVIAPLTQIQEDKPRA